MKSQDILLLLKLISLHRHDVVLSEWFSARGLAATTGISKTEVNASLNRSIAVGLAKYDRHTQLPKVNISALYGFIASGLRYVFPAKPTALARGLLTGFAAPGLEGLVASVQGECYVWPDAEGQSRGQAISPLYKTAVFAAKQDEWLYQVMALIDAIRLGSAREVAVAKAELKKRLAI